MKNFAAVNDNKDSLIFQEKVKISGQMDLSYQHSLLTVFISFCATFKDTCWVKLLHLVLKT